MQLVKFSAPIVMGTKTDGLTALYAAETPNLLRLLSRRTSNRAEAEDIAQESWIRLGSERAATLDRPVRYLRRIAFNLAIDEQRKSARQRLSPVEIDALLDVPDDAAGPEEITVMRGEIAALQRILDELPERQKDILIAARLHDEPYKAIAARYGVTTRTVENEIRRALDYCLQKMKNDSTP